jgi:hypothetical protein
MLSNFKAIKLGLFRYSMMVNGCLFLGWAITHLLHPRIVMAVWLAAIPFVSWMAWLYLIYQENVLLGDLSPRAKIYWWSMPVVMMLAIWLGGVV